MIRELLVAAAITGGAVGLAPAALADSRAVGRRRAGDQLLRVAGRAGDNYDRFIFGRGPGGQAEACHFIINQFPAAQTGYGVMTYPLYGVQQVGAKCDNPRGIIGAVARRTGDAVHRARLADRSADRRRGPEWARRRIPVRHEHLALPLRLRR